MASGAKEMFETIVRARQTVHLVAQKQPIPIAGRDFLKVRDRRGQGSKLIGLLCHGGQELLIRSFQGVDIALFGIGEQVGRLVHPRRGLVDGREEAFSRRSSRSPQVVEMTEFGGKPLFARRGQSSRRYPGGARLRCNPSASRGGRPSSVSALALRQAIATDGFSLVIRALL